MQDFKPTKNSMELARRLKEAGFPLPLPDSGYAIQRHPGNQFKNRQQGMDYPIWYLCDQEGWSFGGLTYPGHYGIFHIGSDISVREILASPGIKAHHPNIGWYEKDMGMLRVYPG